MNLLGTPFLDYALHLSSLLMMKTSLLYQSSPSIAKYQKRDTTVFLHKTFDVHRRRLRYWKLTRAYSRVLRAAYEEYAKAKRQGLRHHDFGVSIEYGSIENMEMRDVEIDDEDRDSREVQAVLVSEGSPTNEPTLSFIMLNEIEVPFGLRHDDVLDIDSLLAAQNAVEVIQGSLAIPSDEWWNDLFGNDPTALDFTTF